MIGWSFIALLSGLLGKRQINNRSIILFTVFSFLAAYIYGLIVNLGTFTYAGNFIAYYLAGIPFDSMHAIGNVGFMLVLYPILTKLLKKQEKYYI